MENMNIGHHISRQFNEELEDVRNQVLIMGGLVEQQVIDAVKSLVEGDSRLAQEVIENDRKVNGLEVAIDEECTQILARRQPAASDLRLVIAVIKTITDLERIGDQAEKIARMGLHLNEMERPKGQYYEVRSLGERVAKMLHQTLDSFARMDVDAAIKVSQQDDIIDHEYDGILRKMVTFMMEDPRSIKRSLDVIWSVRALERVGDHSQNICEYVIYLVKGKDIRHTEYMRKAVKD
ncbi:MAG: phosphate signaling complex protein PhoU [Gammaproteobacteria bacterium]|nr:phosphate signaling complex protein PhoU [Gammaproteobacteria bacterium]